MELTIFFAKVLGLYMLIAGLAIFINKRHIMGAIVGLMHERAAQLIGGLIALILGLVVVNLHNEWSTLPAALISLIGWVGVLKGIAYLFLPEAMLAKLMKSLTERSWYLADGIVAVILGLYLSGFGFGWF
ncbi:MAG: hypothetical protein WBK28_02495 [Minisyncoccia bacterium]